jgi:peptide/nickel transport system substrate-binding protein
MRRSRITILLMVVLSLLLSLATVHAQGDNILHIVLNPDMRTSDPHIAYETETWPTASLFYVGLVKLDDSSSPIPALAESWTISDDGLVYTFTLRDGIKFSNGRDITADDVKYSFERLLNPATAAPTAFMFTDIAGTPEFEDGSATEVSGIKVLDPKTVQFTLSTPVWSIMQRFALPPAFIVAKEGVQAAGDQFGFQPLGAGPFMLDSWESGVKITGVRNPYYYEEGKPYFDGFELDLGVEPSVGVLRIENGEADVSLDFVPNADYTRLKDDSTLSKQLLPTAGFPNTDYMILNNNKAPFDKLEVRQAISKAIDRERMSQILNNRAVPLGGFLPPGIPGDNPNVLPDTYDPEAAKALLAQAGLPDGFHTTLLTNTDPISVDESQAVINDLAQIGIQVDLTTIDNAQFLDLLVSKPDDLEMVMTSWFMDYVDPSDNWEPLLKCGGSYNWAKYCNEGLDAEFAKANLLPQGDSRWAAFADFEAKVAEQVPNVFLVHRVDYYFTSARLDLKTNPAILMNFADAKVK